MTYVEYLKGQTALNRGAKEHYGIAKGRGTSASILIGAALDCEHTLLSAVADGTICLDDFDSHEREYLIQQYLIATPFGQVYDERFGEAAA